MVSSVAENEGKSSIASNVALALAEKGRRVLLVDTDLKKPAQHKIFEKPGSKGKSLTDYLDGDRYYKIRHPDHNWQRSKAQFRLLQSIDAHERAMRDFIAGL